MKKRLIMMIVLMILLGCTPASNNNTPTDPQPQQKEKVTVTYLNPDGSLLKKDTFDKGFAAFRPDYSEEGRIVYGWFNDETGSFWNFNKVVSEDMTLKVVCYDDVTPTSVYVTYQDIEDYYLKEYQTNAMVVVYLNFTDGHPYDENFLRDIFEKQTDSFNRLESVASYYSYTSHRHVNFEFHYYCYDTGMTSKQGYDYVQKYYNKLCYEAFDQFKKNYQGDIHELDKDDDGYIDLGVIIGGEDTSLTVGDGENYYLYGGSLSNTANSPNRTDPVFYLFPKMGIEHINKPLEPGRSRGGIRILIHEIGHAFGLMDYYDYMEYEGTSIDVLGGFDMQSFDLGDWNPYSRLACGWLDPYVITEDMETVTLKIGCTSSTGEAILIPTSKGYNGTAFDEYILIDVMAPEGANGYDWKGTMDPRLVSSDDPKKDGGVRVYHVDSRLIKFDNGKKSIMTTAEEILNERHYEIWGYSTELSHLYSCSNGYEPYIEGDSRFHHKIEIIPSDGTSKYRLSTPTNWSIYTIFSVKDLFGPGEVFSMETCSDSFPDGPLMNNGGTFDYSVKVDYYDPVAHEAIITVTKIR